MPLEKIADQLGYSDQASFSKAYRSWTGRTPGEVRRTSRPDRN
ncbi:AraC family transcriptional regulator, partial [Alcanivorax sp. HI0007]